MTTTTTTKTIETTLAKPRCMKKTAIVYYGTYRSALKMDDAELTMLTGDGQRRVPAYFDPEG